MKQEMILIVVCESEQCPSLRMLCSYKDANQIQNAARNYHEVTSSSILCWKYAVVLQLEPFLFDVAAAELVEGQLVNKTKSHLGVL